MMDFMILVRLLNFSCREWRDTAIKSGGFNRVFKVKRNSIAHSGKRIEVIPLISPVKFAPVIRGRNLCELTRRT